MKKCLLALLVLSFCLSLFSADEKMDFLRDFLPGEYVVVGKYPDSEIPYYGRISVKREDESFLVVRRFEDREVRCQGTLEQATADKVIVLRLEWPDGQNQYLGTYMIHSDLDNYPRLTGLVYRTDVRTRWVGLEAWFSDQNLR
jgi:hypothetical protein